MRRILFPRRGGQADDGLDPDLTSLQQSEAVQSMHRVPVWSCPVQAWQGPHRKQESNRNEMGPWMAPGRPDEHLADK